MTVDRHAFRVIVQDEDPVGNGNMNRHQLLGVAALKGADARTGTEWMTKSVQLEVSLHGCLHKVLHYGLEIAVCTETGVEMQRLTSSSSKPIVTPRVPYCI